MSMINKIDIIPCPRCIKGQMFYDIHLHEYDCVDCGYNYSPTKSTVPSVLQSNAVFQGSGRPKYNDRSE